MSQPSLSFSRAFDKMPSDTNRIISISIIEKTKAGVVKASRIGFAAISNVCNSSRI